MVLSGVFCTSRGVSPGLWVRRTEEDGSERVDPFTRPRCPIDSSGRRSLSRKDLHSCSRRRRSSSTTSSRRGGKMFTGDTPPGPDTPGQVGSSPVFSRHRTRGHRGSLSGTTLTRKSRTRGPRLCPEFLPFTGSVREGSPEGRGTDERVRRDEREDSGADDLGRNDGSINRCCRPRGSGYFY